MRGTASSKPCPLSVSVEVEEDEDHDRARRGFGVLLRWARALEDERVWALEDCRHVSGSLERFLIARGERVLRIPTHLTATARRSARQRGKSDAIDALG